MPDQLQRVVWFNYPEGNEDARLRVLAISAQVKGLPAFVRPRDPTQDWPAVEEGVLITPEYVNV